MHATAMRPRHGCAGCMRHRPGTAQAGNCKLKRRFTQGTTEGKDRLKLRGERLIDGGECVGYEIHNHARIMEERAS